MKEGAIEGVEIFAHLLDQQDMARKLGLQRGAAPPRPRHPVDGGVPRAPGTAAPAPRPPPQHPPAARPPPRLLPPLAAALPTHGPAPRLAHPPPYGYPHANPTPLN